MERSGFRVYGLDHVQLAMPVGQEDAARAFYAGVLGLTEVAKPPHLARRGGVWFTGGSLRLHLGVEAEFRPARLKRNLAVVPQDTPARHREWKMLNQILTQREFLHALESESTRARERDHRRFDHRRLDVIAFFFAQVAEASAVLFAVSIFLAVAILLAIPVFLAVTILLAIAAAVGIAFLLLRDASALRKFSGRHGFVQARLRRFAAADCIEIDAVLLGQRALLFRRELLESRRGRPRAVR